MTPRTRSSTKTSPGRTTRNSLYGRPPPQPQPRKTRKSPLKSTITTAPVAVTIPDVELPDEDVDDLENAENAENIAPTASTPWLACRDGHGVYTTVAVSQTGKGIHVRWYHPEDAHVGDVDEQGEDATNADADVDMDMDADDYSEVGRATTPSFVAGPSNPARRPFVPQTPVDLHSFDAGSVVRTPVKKTRQIQRSPVRIGDKGIRCLYDQGGVLRELNNGNRFVLNHPVGSSANLSRYQVEQLEKERERKIIEEQLAKLMAEKKRLEAEEDMQEEYFSDSGYEEKMDTEEPSSRRPTETVESRGPPFFRGPHGELLDRFGRQMFGPEGTILIHNGPNTTLPRGVRAVSEVPTEIIEEDEPSMEEDANDEEEAQEHEEPPMKKVRFGPEGTELID